MEHLDQTRYKLKDKCMQKTGLEEANPQEKSPPLALINGHSYPTLSSLTAQYALCDPDCEHDFETG
jgi:hypothetical protein